MKRLIGCRLLLSLIGCLAVQYAAAQSYPSKPIMIIVPYGPGGVTDVVARAAGTELSVSVGQPVLVLNRPGAGTAIGMHECAKAPPDGYTLCITAPDSLSYLPQLTAELGYDAEKDFTPIANLAWTSNVLVARSGMPFNTFAEMVAYAKAKPGSLNWGTWGEGTLPDVYLRWVRHMAGIDIVAVPFKGLAPNLNALLQTNEIDLTYLGVGTALTHMQSGKIKPLAIVGKQRSPLMPDVPTLDELGGDPGLRSYFGVYGPAKMPAAIVEQLNKEFSNAMQSPKLTEFRKNFTLDPAGGSAAEFAAFVKEDQANAARVFKDMGFKPVATPK
jgi:tripartite-type tricarboxylate transporter receptor subunit TctC